jgi:hypothetical protein
MRYPLISTGMRLHGLYELFRRAGVKPADWAGCRFSLNERYIEVQLGWENGKRIEFPVFPPSVESSGTARLKWLFPPSDRTRELVSDFVLPHHPEPLPDGPLFEQVDGGGTIRCKTDLPLIALAVLNRWEEVQSSERDQWGRFAARASVAFQEEFLHRPIVDEYGLALEQVLKVLSPNWLPSPREPRLKVSHDIDLTGIPFRLSSAIGATVRRHRPLDTFLYLLSVLPGVDPPTLKTVDRIVQLSLKEGLDSAVYWMAAKPSQFDTGYSLFDRRIQTRINVFAERGVEMGLHPSFFTFGDPVLLAKEVSEWRSAVGEQQMGGRQHFLRWLPQTWSDWAKAGLSYDSSVGYADCIGFRAGTCIPYRPWSLEEDQPLHLLEVPLLVMESTLIASDYMGLKKEEAVVHVRKLAERCRAVGGVFTLLYHNSSLTDPPFGEKFYFSLVEATGLKGKFNCFDDLNEQMQVPRPVVISGARQHSSTNTLS